MLLIKAIAFLYCLIFGIACQIIDYKHVKRKAYERGDGWPYYAKLSREGNREAQFMMFSTYVGIAIVIGTLAFLAFSLLTAH